VGAPSRQKTPASPEAPDFHEILHSQEAKSQELYPSHLNSAHPLSSDIYIDKGNTMHMLYDSESFVVVHMLPDAVEKKSTQALNDTAPAAPQLARHGFEIVDKRSGKEVYLDGSWAEMFQEQILAWQRDTPTQEEVEDALDRYAGLAQNPVVVH
jgi:hypothetical protein